jgi:hypothetical protein
MIAVLAPSKTLGVARKMSERQINTQHCKQLLRSCATPKKQAWFTTYLRQHGHHLNTLYQPSHQFPYIYHEHNQLVLILAFKFFICRKGNAMSSATYGIIWMWLWCRLIDVAVIHDAIHHQVVLERRENFRNWPIGLIELSEKLATS